MVNNRIRTHRAFTLIEILVVVAIIGLLVSILIPALSKARDQAKRTLCTSNMHQTVLALTSYAADQKSFLPSRGWFSYTYSEVPAEAYGWGGTANKTLINLGLLVGGTSTGPYTGKLAQKYIKGWDVLFCPNTAGRYYENMKQNLWNKDDRFTAGGYMYAVPEASRNQAAKLGMEVYPRNKDDLHGYYLAALAKVHNAKFGTSFTTTYNPVSTITQDAINRLMPRRTEVLVMELVGGGGSSTHKGGWNVGYSDGHARFKKHDGPVKEEIAVDNVAAATAWYEMTVAQ